MINFEIQNTRKYNDLSLYLLILSRYVFNKSVKKLLK